MEVDTITPTFDAYNADFYGREDSKNEYSGKTVRNNYWKQLGHFFDKVFDIQRKNNKHLTLFDVVFGIIPKYLKERSYVFSDDNFSFAIDFLEENNVYTRKDRKQIIYHIPVIGLYEKFDEKKKKYIYRTENEEKIPYSITDDVVVFKVWSSLLSDTKYFSEKNTHMKLYQQTDKSYKREKYGRKSNRKDYDFE